MNTAEGNSYCMVPALDESKLDGKFLFWYHFTKQYIIIFYLGIKYRSILIPEKVEMNDDGSQIQSFKEAADTIEKILLEVRVILPRKEKECINILWTNNCHLRKMAVWLLIVLLVCRDPPVASCPTSSLRKVWMLMKHSKPSKWNAMSGPVMKTLPTWQECLMNCMDSKLMIWEKMSIKCWILEDLLNPKMNQHKMKF